jgi:hypothetical protein
VSGSIICLLLNSQTVFNVEANSIRTTATSRCHGNRSVFSLVKQYSCRIANIDSVAVWDVMKPGSIKRVKMAVVVKSVHLGIIHIALPHLADVYV